MTAPEEFLLLTDPEWEEDGDDTPPYEAVIGVWPRLPDGEVGEFRPNPDYVPRYENSPADPIDAVLRLALGGEVEVAQLMAVWRECRVELAMNGDGRPMVVRSDDDVLCATVATSVTHRQRLFSPDWRDIGPTELLDLLADGTDVLVNPGSPAHVRLAYDFLRESVA